jgi:hypothetical protein
MLGRDRPVIHAIRMAAIAQIRHHRGNAGDPIALARHLDSPQSAGAHHGQGRLASRLMATPCPIIRTTAIMSTVSWPVCA